MRTALGILLLIGGVLWALPGVMLLALSGQGLPDVTQTEPGSELIHSHYVVVTVFGQAVSVATACAIAFIPAAALVALGLHLLMTERRSARG